MIRYGDMRITSLPLTGGVDEISPTNKLDPKRAVEMENFRLSKDGSRIQKRLGLTEEVTNFAVDIYGYTTYYNLAGTFCELAILETGISRFVTGGAWASIHSFSSSIAHPVIPIETQGKMFIINEVDSRMIHHDSADYQIGITAPTSVPSTSVSFATADTQPINDLMVYANQGAMDAVWADADSGTGASTYSTTDPDSTVGPDADSKYMRFTTGAFGTSAYARRTQSPATSIGDVFSIETAMYIDNLGYISTTTYFEIAVYTGAFRVQIRFARNGVWLSPLSGLSIRIAPTVVLNRWDKWKFNIDGSDVSNIQVTSLLNDTEIGTYSYYYPDTTNPNLVQLTLWRGTTYLAAAPDLRLDNFKISSTNDNTAVLEGTHRYAVTYYRGGNFPCESNPIKSAIGSVTFSGAGTNDLTVTGTYTGASNKTFRVYVVTGNAGGGTKDIIKWSEDNGVTWSAQMACDSTMYLPYGLTLTFGTTTTTHTTDNYWSFTCSVCAASPTKQQVTLTSIPTSADAQVSARRIYRTAAGGSRFYYLMTINDNVTTTITDNIPDALLGALLEEDHDTLSGLGTGVGKFSEWWDDRMWVSGDDIVYYSQQRYPEHFDLDGRYVTIKKGNPNDEIMGLKAFKDALYVFLKKSIYAIQKTSTGYGSYLVCHDTGVRASWSIIEVNNMLMFISDRGIEAFNGVDVYPICPSDIIERTIGTINTAYYDFITAVHHKQYYEVWFSIPDRTSGSAITIVYHYPSNEFYFFSFYKTPSCLSSCLTSTGKRVTKIGTRDGYLCLTESTYRDHTTAITATYRKGWIDAVAYEDIRRLEVEYELPASMSLTSNVYVNFQDTAARTDTHAGATPGATDIELRRPIFDFTELGQRAKYFAVEFTNAENLGGELKINDIKIYHRDRAHKGRIAPN